MIYRGVRNLIRRAPVSASGFWTAKIEEFPQNISDYIPIFNKLKYYLEDYYKEVAQPGNAMSIRQFVELYISTQVLLRWRIKDVLKEENWFVYHPSDMHLYPKHWFSNREDLEKCRPKDVQPIQIWAPRVLTEYPCLFTDGSSTEHHGTGLGFLLLEREHGAKEEHGANGEQGVCKYIVHSSHRPDFMRSEATEWLAFTEGIEFARGQGHTRLNVFTDLKDIADVMNCQQYPNPQQESSYFRARKAVSGLEDYTLHHILRDANKVADYMAKKARLRLVLSANDMDEYSETLAKMYPIVMTPYVKKIAGSRSSTRKNDEDDEDDDI